MREQALRGAALLIAVAGLLDPSFTVDHRVAPVIELHVAGGHEPLAAAVADTLEGRFALSPAPVAGAAARVVVGGTLPAASDVPTFAVARDDALAIVALDVPARAPLQGRVPVRVSLRAPAGLASAADAVVALQVDGLTADSVPLAELTPGPSGELSAALTFVPTTTRPHHVRVVVGDVHADALVTVHDTPWRVLSHDARPSWAATFVRRALEADPRFAVAAQIDTAPRSAVATGSPPRLADAGGLAAFDAVVLGAPDALDDADRRVLDAFMRRRGGSVIVLIDGAPGIASQLGGVASWLERLSPASLPLRDARAGGAAAGDIALRASELALPARLPAGARVLAAADAQTGSPAATDAVIWQRPVGRGRLVVSGALDAWRFRGADAGAFDRFWREVVADAAAAAPAPVTIDATRRVGRPGESVRLEVSVRDLVLGEGADRGISLGARLEGDGASTPVRLWPLAPGRLAGRVRLPETAGDHRLVVESDAGAASLDLQVADDARRPETAGPALRASWAAAQGGLLVPASRLAELSGALDAAIAPQSRPRRVHPMQSAWWIIPFAAALGGEWWLRRRRGAR